jgi:predicted DNA-binding transcriptional regulator AlpA
MRPTVTAKTDTQPAARSLPADLAAVAFLDIRDVCAAVRMSASWVHDEVRAQRFPQPVIRQSRCTRWKSADVRDWLIRRAAQSQTEAGDFVKARATKASRAAQAKRIATADAA